jgi:hypothetical protein
VEGTSETTREEETKVSTVTTKEALVPNLSPKYPNTTLPRNLPAKPKKKRSEPIAGGKSMNATWER